MGRKSSISREQGEQLLLAYHRTGDKTAAAHEVGVSEDAAWRFLSQFPVAATPAIAMQQELVEQIGHSLFDARGALSDNYDALRTLIQQLQDGIMLIQGEYTTYTPPATLVAALREARMFVESAVKLEELVLRQQEMRAFQDAVLTAIGEVDAPTRQRIIAILRERAALGIALGGTG